MKLRILLTWILILAAPVLLTYVFLRDVYAGLAAVGFCGLVVFFDYRRYAARTNAFALWAYAVTRYLQTTRGSLSRFALDTDRLAKFAGGQRPVIDPTELPAREGGRPAMVHGLPHRQLDQHPAPEMREYFRRRVVQMDDLTDRARSRVRFQPSLWELTGAEALIVQDCSAETCSVELMRAKGEFAHLHSHDGSMHMILPVPDIITVIQKEWGDLFPISGGLWGRIPQVALVYAPRTKAEVEIVGRVLRASYKYATSSTGEAE